MRSPPRRRDPERGAALALTLVAITALLGLAALTVLSVRTELVHSGQSRFTQAALYAAESGAAAGMDFLRTNCSTTSLFSQWVTPSNTAPIKPTGIYGNGARPGGSENPFLADSDLWYEVVILNNTTDARFQDGLDTDGIVILRSTGHGPDQTMAAIELEILNAECLGAFCAQEYAQRGMGARNDANAACSAQISSGTLRTFTP
jgi:hypothetical protein